MLRLADLICTQTTHYPHKPSKREELLVSILIMNQGELAARKGYVTKKSARLEM